MGLEEIEELWPDPDKRDAGLERLLLRVQAGERRTNDHHYPDLPRVGPMLDASLDGEDAKRWLGISGSIPSTTELTESEKLLLAAISQGLTAKEAADVLGRTSETIKTKLKTIYRKMAVKNATQAVAEALRQGLIA